MNSHLHYFVTGTDTEIGKTLASCALLHRLAARGLRVAGMKPVAAGAQFIDGQWRNEDVDQLLAASNIDIELSTLNPYLLRDPIAPHIAAAEEGVQLDLRRIANCYEALRARADAVIVEGVGGFRVPLDETHDTADLARTLNLPVVLVVGMRLGCLNHALLTQDAILARGLRLAGWIANRCAPQMLRFDQNLEALQRRLQAPLLGCIPHLERPLAQEAAKFVWLPDEHPT